MAADGKADATPAGISIELFFDLAADVMLDTIAGGRLQLVGPANPQLPASKVTS